MDFDHFEFRRVESIETTSYFRIELCQVYENFMFMDFNESLLKSQGYGKYEVLNVEFFPYLWLAYTDQPSDSGQTHSDVYARFEAQDETVLAAVDKFRGLTDEAKVAIETKNWVRLGELMNANFDLRRELYGDEIIGEVNLRMIEIGRSLNCPTKLPGSGGSVIGLASQWIKLVSI